MMKNQKVTFELRLNKQGKIDGRTINKLRKFQAPQAKQTGRPKSVRLTKAGVPDKRYLKHWERNEIVVKAQIFERLKAMPLSKLEQLLIKIA